MILKYQSGIEIRKGDRILFDGVPSEIELVAAELGDPETDWYVQEFGGGVMILELEGKEFGRIFIRAESLENNEDLEFVARGPAQ
jgi:hypothetical protein